MSDTRYVRVAALKTADLFRQHLSSSGIDLGFDDALVAPADDMDTDLHTYRFNNNTPMPLTG